MTIEEKAKAYDEAIEKAKSKIKNDKDHIIYEDDVIEIFPELIESEDERIREEIINYFQCQSRDEPTRKDIHNKWIAWLEKQGEKKVPVNDFKAKDWYISKVDGKIHNIYHSVDKVEPIEWSGKINSRNAKGVLKEMLDKKLKSADNTEPKFKSGDWITNGDYTWKIVEVEPLDYVLQSQDGNIVDDTISHVDEQFHSFTIQDAKDGDVLQLGEVTAIFQEYIGDGNCACYCSVCDGEFEIPSQDSADNSYGCHNAIPATKEQRNLLFQKMHDARYEWDAVKKELKKIEQKSADEEIKEALRTEYEKGRADVIAEIQKSAWSEEDEKMCQETIDWFEKKCFPYALESENPARESIKWLKSIKEHVQPQQKVEWGEEDERKINRIYSILGQAADTHAFSTTCRLIGDKECIELQDFLKSLKERIGE